MEVDVDHGPSAASSRRQVLAGGLEQLEDALGVGEPAEGLGAQLVAADVRRQVGNKVAAGVERVGDPVDEVADPERGTGLDVGDDVLHAVIVDARERDEAVAQLLLEAAGVGGRVSLDDLGAGQLEDPGGRLSGDRGGDRRVDDPDHGQVEGPGHRGDLARHPGLALQRLDHLPGAGQPVAQVEYVGHRGAHGKRLHAASDRELGQAQLLHQWRPVATDLDDPVLTVPAPPLDRPPPRVVGVQIGPVGDQSKVLDLGGSTSQ
ncbi:hypothetical protein [Nocardioides sp. T2.26MG-1]|uniref:hypothetical protein n=1 Tax=Nocardioides sp. T2.26MG-1 TaxID=3041166 RepID=UPI0025400C08|nr:hypothetical protein [Nocardioides sp. T2.26MG-1]